MIVTVKEYLEETNEISCIIAEIGAYSGSVIIADPFVMCAIETTDDNFREIGRSMVGKVYEMSDYEINDDDVYLPEKFKLVQPSEVPVNNEVKYAKYTIAEDGPDKGKILKDGHTMFPQDIVTDLNRKSFLEKNKVQVNEFIGDIAKLLGEDDLGHDGKTWAIDDFKDAIERVKTEAIEESSKEYCKYCDTEINPTSRLIDGLGRPFCNTSCLSGHQHSKGF